MTTKPRAYTEEEIREKFIEAVKVNTRYWEEQEDLSVHDRVEGAVFSALVILDGESFLPGFAVIPRPHPDDRDYDISNGRNWYPNDVDISGCLHEQLLSQKI